MRVQEEAQDQKDYQIRASSKQVSETANIVTAVSPKSVKTPVSNFPVNYVQGSHENKRTNIANP